VPPQPALPRCGAEDQFGGDQGTPGEGPTDLEACENARKCRGNKNFGNEAYPAQPVVLPDHAMRYGNAPEPGVRVECDRPKHRMNEYKDQATRTQSEPDQGKRQ